MAERVEVRTELARLLDAARAGVERAQRRGRQQPDDRPDPLNGLWSGALSLLDAARALLPAGSDPADAAAERGDAAARGDAAESVPDGPRRSRPERIEIS